MRELTRGQRAAVADMLRDIRRFPRYQGGWIIHTDGTAAETVTGGHAFGAYECDRANDACGTKDDVAKLRAALRREGLRLSFDDVDALLGEALWHDRGGESWYTVTMPRKAIYESRAEAARAKRKRQIERRRAAGLCIVCGAPTGDRVTCVPCGYAANVRQRKARASKTDAA